MAKERRGKRFLTLGLLLTRKRRGQEGSQHLHGGEREEGIKYCSTIGAERYLLSSFSPTLAGGEEPGTDEPLQLWNTTQL